MGFGGLKTPTLIAQGERDAMGNRDTVAGYQLSEKIKLHWAPDGNHDLSPRKKSGYKKEQNWRTAIETVANFVSADQGDS